MLLEVIVVLIELGFLLAGLFVICRSIRATYYLIYIRPRLKMYLLGRLFLTIPTAFMMIIERLIALERNTFTYDPETIQSALIINVAEEIFININMLVNGCLSIWFTINLKSLTSRTTLRLERFYAIVVVFFIIFNIVNYSVDLDPSPETGFYRPYLTYFYSAIVWAIIIYNDFAILRVLELVPMEEASRVELIRSIRINHRSASFFYVAMGCGFFLLLTFNVISVASIFIAVLFFVTGLYYVNSTKVFGFLDNVYAFTSTTRKIESNLGTTYQKETNIKTVPVSPESDSIQLDTVQQ